MAYTHNLFITHGWSYEDSYYRILDYLDQISNNYENFEYINHSQPDPDTPDRSYTEELKVEYQDQITSSNVILLLTDLYRRPEKGESNFIYWIEYALDKAKEHEIPVLAIRPWDEMKTPKEITHLPNDWVDWNPEALKNALESYI